MVRSLCMENKDLKFIKKFYGEKMMHLCREYFPTILESEGRLSQIMENNFAPTRALYEALVEQKMLESFREFIVYKSEQKNIQSEAHLQESPQALLDKAGYILYPECKTGQDIQKFRKYYARGEELCTFNGNRLATCRVWFAVKKNVDEIKRENFAKPAREDEYGTSVISIQFSREGGWISIKNRYNHSVANPDNTFCNKLDNIIPNLDYNFRAYFGLPLKPQTSEEQFHLDNFVMAEDGKYYHVNLEIDGFYFCEDNVVINAGNVANFDKTRDILMDNILIDKQRKKIEVLSSLFDYDDSCVYGIGKIENISEVKTENGDKDIIITNVDGKKVIFTINKYSQIVGYTNENLIHVQDNFLTYNGHIKNISLPNAKTIGNNFLQNTHTLESINIPKVEIIGDDCMQFCNGIEKISMPSIKQIGKNFLLFNRSVLELIAPELTKIDDEFLCNNTKTNTCIMPSVTQVGDNFLINNRHLKEIYLPNVERVGDNFLTFNEKIADIDFPKLKSCGKDFLRYNSEINTINLPNLESCEDNFLKNNLHLLYVDLPNLKSCGDKFISLNNNIKNINMPKLEKCGAWFLANNTHLTSINLPSLGSAQNFFLKGNNRISNVELPNLQKVGCGFMLYNEKIETAYFPNLTKYDEGMLLFNKSVKIYAPKCENADNRFVTTIQEESETLTK